MDNFFRRQAPRPSDYGGLPGKITRDDDAGNVYDETGRKIFNKFDQTEQPDSWLDTAISTATAPAKLATALVGSLNPYGQDGWQVPPIISEPAAAFARSGESTGFGDDGRFYLPNVQNPQVAQDTLTQLMTVYGGNALNPLARVPKGGLASGAVKQASDALPMDQAITGWHGSKHDFDKFSMDKIGTGTGFAWDGYGLNFSDYRPTAEAYRDMTDGAYLYQAELPSGPYLDYELPLNQHPPEVQAAITDLLSAQRDSPDFAAISDPNLPVGNHYGTIAWNGKLDHRKLNEELSKRGVVGRVVDNPDQPGSRNYTLFQEPTIAHKWRGDDQLFSDNKPSLLGSALASGQGEARGITAYHGSPHDFDRFDLSKIGTGEGAQAYGHGLYFAENEGVAKSYRNQLGKSQLDGLPDDEIYDVKDGLRWVKSGRTGRVSSNARLWVDDAKSQLEGEGIANPTDQQIADRLDEQLRPNGHMYQVRINANPEDFLDWDKPLSQQSESVRNALATELNKLREDYAKITSMDPLDMRASEFYRGLADDSVASASKLKELGVPGIRYLDAYSRGDVGTVSRNYVLNDDSLIEILKKYGWLAPGAMYGANSLLDQQDQQQPY